MRGAGERDGEAQPFLPSQPTAVCSRPRECANARSDPNAVPKWREQQRHHPGQRDHHPLPEAHGARRALLQVTGPRRARAGPGPDVPSAPAGRPLSPSARAARTEAWRPRAGTLRGAAACGPPCVYAPRGSRPGAVAAGRGAAVGGARGRRLRGAERRPGAPKHAAGLPRGADRGTARPLLGAGPPGLAFGAHRGKVVLGGGAVVWPERWMTESACAVGLL